MNIDEAWRIIDACKNWDTGQRSFHGDAVARRLENDIFDMKLNALKCAWTTIMREETK